MITVFVQFPIPKHYDINRLEQDFYDISGLFFDVPGLLRKYFVISAAENSAGGVYLWESRSQAEAFFNANFRLLIQERYGATPTITYFDCPIVVDNQFRYEFRSVA